MYRVLQNRGGYCIENIEYYTFHRMFSEFYRNVSAKIMYSIILVQNAIVFSIIKIHRIFYNNSIEYSITNSTKYFLNFTELSRQKSYNIFYTKSTYLLRVFITQIIILRWWIWSHLSLSFNVTTKLRQF